MLRVNEVVEIRKMKVAKVELLGCPLCDGCGKEIENTPGFLKFFWTMDGGEYELHSHDDLNCTGKVLRLIVESA